MIFLTMYTCSIIIICKTTLLNKATMMKKVEYKYVIFIFLLGLEIIGTLEM